MGLSAAQLNRELHHSWLQTEVLEVWIRLVEGAIGFGLGNISGKAFGGRLFSFFVQLMSQLKILFVFLKHKLTVGILDRDFRNVFLFKFENLLFFFDGFLPLFLSLDLVEIDPGK